MFSCVLSLIYCKGDVSVVMCPAVYESKNTKHNVFSVSFSWKCGLLLYCYYNLYIAGVVSMAESNIAIKMNKNGPGPVSIASV